MQHQTVPQNAVDLSHAGVDNILAALANAGIEVHYNETDGETFLDIWLTDLDADTPVVLGWRDSEGRQLRSWDSNDTAQPPTRKWPIAAGSPAEVARDVASILAGSAQTETAERPGLTAAMTAGRALLAAGWRYDSTSPMADYTTIRTLLHPSGREIHARTVDGGEQTDLTLTGLTLDQVAGAVTGAGLVEPVAPKAIDTKPAEPDLHQRLADELHRIADAIVTNRLPLSERLSASLHLGVLNSRADLEQWAVHLGSKIVVDSNSIPHTEAKIRLGDTAYVPDLTVGAQIRPDGRSEVERLREENETLRTQLADGGTR